ncbi:MAG: hypothetical protein JSS49_19060 [Planctomycetes bacterium]|nr:hypothetical protein [Planctomycetota bacterium]
MQEPHRVFRCSFLYFFCWTAVIGFVAYVCLIPVAVLCDDRLLHVIPFPFLLLSAAVMAMIAAAMAALVAVVVVSLHVYQDGLLGQDCWGRRCWITWTSVSRVARINIVGLRYLKIYGDAGSRVLWMPEFLARRLECDNVILALVPQDHPLREQLLLSR